jgi:DNA-binding NtrC family response regulator
MPESTIVQSVLLIDDDPLSLQALAHVFSTIPCNVTLHTDPVSAIQQCMKDNFDLVISDQRMSVMTGMDLLANIRKLQPECRRVIISVYKDLEEIIAGFNEGLVHKFLSKPWEAEVIRTQILEELAQSGNFSQSGFSDWKLPVSKASDLMDFHGLLTTNARLQKSLEFITKVAATGAPFCINGETGTGKELVARAIHMSGQRSNGPFVAMNCANFTETLLESQLFGHRKGAFTGAINDHRGLLSVAEGGTLFLDEVVELPLQLQAKRPMAGQP